MCEKDVHGDAREHHAQGYPTIAGARPEVRERAVHGNGHGFTYAYGIQKQARSTHSVKRTDKKATDIQLRDIQ